MYLGQLEPFGPSPVATSAPMQSERIVVVIVVVEVLVAVVAEVDVEVYVEAVPVEEVVVMLL